MIATQTLFQRGDMRSCHGAGGADPGGLARHARMLALYPAARAPGAATSCWLAMAALREAAPSP